MRAGGMLSEKAHTQVFSQSMPKGEDPLKKGRGLVIGDHNPRLTAGFFILPERLDT